MTETAIVLWWRGLRCKYLGHVRDVRNPWWERRCRRCRRQQHPSPRPFLNGRTEASDA